MALGLGCWLDESAVESPESGVKETWVEEMTQIERFEDIEAKNSQQLRVLNVESGVENLPPWACLISEFGF